MYSVKIATTLGEIYIISSNVGVRSLHLSVPGGVYEPGDPFNAAGQVEEYLSGKRRAFELPLDVEGTAFQKSVWQCALQIEYGKTMTYKQIAVMLGKPKASRAVGGALSKNPVPIIIPCHRVVGSTGLTGFAWGLNFKEKLLKLESRKTE